MRLTAIGLLPALMAGQAAAADLACSGTLYAGSQQLPFTTLVKINADADSIAVKTLKGWVVGTLGNDPETYMGWLNGPNGVRYWYNLNRYTGQAIWMEDAGDQAIGKVEFSGTCAPARPMF